MQYTHRHDIAVIFIKLESEIFIKALAESAGAAEYTDCILAER